MSLRHSSPPPGRPVPWFTATAFAEACGDQMTRSLAPIIAVSLLGAGTATVGLLHSLGLAMFLLLSIPLGVLGDRLSRPVSMMSSSTSLRIAVLGCGVIAWVLGVLQGALGLGILLGIALVIGIADVVFTTGRSVLVPRLVPPERIRPMMGSVHTAAQIGTVLAPLALTGLLTLTAPPLAWLGAALAYLGSLLAQRRLGGHDHRIETSALSRDAARPAPLCQGVSHLLSEPTLRRVTASSALHNAAAMAANTLLPVIALTEMGLAPATFAGLGGIGAAGGILGASSASHLTARHGLRRVRIAAALATGAGVIPVLLLTVQAQSLPGPSSLWIGLFFGLSGFCTSVSAVAGADLVARLAPHEMLGAVAGAQRTATMGIMPVSAMLVGLLGTLLGTSFASGAWLALALAAALPCLRLTDPEQESTPHPARA